MTRNIGGPTCVERKFQPHAIERRCHPSSLADFHTAMRLKSQDRDYQLKRDEEREKKAQLRARQDLDQLVKEFAAGDKVDARFGRGWFPGVAYRGRLLHQHEDSTYNDVLARDVRYIDDDVSQAAQLVSSQR